MSAAHRVRPLALLLLLLALGGCALLEGPEGGGFNLISVDEEWKMGRELEAEVARQMTMVDDARSDAFLQALGSRLLAASSSSLASLPWTFHLVADDSVNAFNLPGGHVYVHTGLVAALDDYAALASVVGHEIGHGLRRHGAQHMTKQYGFSIVTGMVLGQDPSRLQEMVAGIVTGGAMMKFSRGDEMEADRAGIDLMYRAGIEPRGAVEMLHVLDSLQKGNPSRIERFLASHPMPAERIDRAEEEVRSLPPRPGLVRQTNEFLAFKRRVAVLQ